MSSSAQRSRLQRAINEKSMKILEFTHENDILEYRVLGNTGTVYKVTFEPHQFTCTCPDFLKRKSQCKHAYLVYIKIFEMLPDLQREQNHLTSDEFVQMCMKHQMFVSGSTSGSSSESTSTSENESGSGSGSGSSTSEDECSICFDILGNISECHECYQCHKYIHNICYTTICNYGISSCPLCRADYNATGSDFEKKLQNMFRR